MEHLASTAAVCWLHPFSREASGPQASQRIGLTPQPGFALHQLLLMHLNQSDCSASGRITGNSGEPGRWGEVPAPTAVFRGGWPRRQTLGYILPAAQMFTTSKLKQKSHAACTPRLLSILRQALCGGHLGWRGSPPGWGETGD